MAPGEDLLELIDDEDQQALSGVRPAGDGTDRVSPGRHDSAAVALLLRQQPLPDDHGGPGRVRHELVVDIRRDDSRQFAQAQR